MVEMKSGARISIDTTGFTKELREHLNDQAMKIADKIKADAKVTSAFVDKTGRLRKSIKRKKSKFIDGGYMVKAGGKGAMQAWLVEHGHGGPRPARHHPFLKPALDKNVSEAIRVFNEGMK